MLFKLTTKSIRHGPASLIRRYSRDVWQSSERTDNVSKIHQQLQHGSEACARWNSKRGIRQFEKLSNPEGFMAPSAGIFRRNISSMTLKRETVEVLHKRNFRLQMNSQRMFSSNADLPPHQEIGMPSLSPTMTEGNIARWFKKEGDQVSTGEVLCEVETDKATVEMECMEDGYLAKIVRGDGAQGIQVEEVIAVIVEEEEHLQNFKDYTPSSEASSPETTQPSEPKSEAPVEPVSQQETKTVQPSQVSSSSVKGTGGDGDIAKPAARGKDSPAPVNKAAVGDELDYSDISHSQIRKVTASRLLMSKQTIPHYYLTVDACVDNIMELRKELNLLQEASGLKRISMNDLIIKAAALALKKVPQCNSSWMDDCIRQYHNVNINVAVQTENGLYVPVVRNADKKGLSTISEEVKQLAQKARESSLKPEDYEGGTFTVSNLGGPFGIKQFCAIVNPPQAAILAVGTAEKRVVAEGADQYKASSFMPATLSCDHRVIDGAIGAEWLKAFKGFIEDPESMLL